MNKCVGQPIIERQLVVLLEARQQHGAVQAKVSDQAAEIRFQRTVTKKHEVPGSGVSSGMAIPRVSANERGEVLLLNESR